MVLHRKRGNGIYRKTGTSIIIMWVTEIPHTHSIEEHPLSLQILRPIICSEDLCYTINTYWAKAPFDSSRRIGEG